MRQGLHAEKGTNGQSARNGRQNEQPIGVQTEEKAEPAIAFDDGLHDVTRGLPER